jgi:hypothetical protein
VIPTRSLLAAGLLALAGCASTPPAPPPDVEGTVWEGQDPNGEEFVMHFLPGGKLRYECGRGASEDGTWRQKGPAVFMEMNDRYGEYKGLVAGDRLEGQARNLGGRSWTLWMQRRR